MIIQDIEKKQRLVLMVSIVMGITTVVTCIGCVLFTEINLMQQNRRIYVLDANYNAFSAVETNQGLTMEMEVKSMVELFHSLMYTLGPDRAFIDKNYKRTLNMCDESVTLQYNNMDESGFYNQLVQNNMHTWLMADNIEFDKETMRFRFEGTIRFDRASSSTYFKIVTTGQIQVQPRTERNIHGLMIKNWKIIDYSEK